MENNHVNSSIDAPTGITREKDVSGTEDFVKTFQIILDDLESESLKSAKLGPGQLKTAAASSSSSSGHPDSLRHIDQLLAQRSNLKALLNLHKKVSEQHFRLREPVSCGADGSLTDLWHEVLRLLESKGAHGGEAVNVLCGAHMASLCAAYDDVANRHYEPLLPEIPHEVDEDEGMAVKIVRLVKNREPLGATIKCEDNGSVVIARVMKGGSADRSGCIQTGDKVVEVNGCSVLGKQPHEIVEMLSGTNGTVTFKLIPAGENFLSEAAVSGIPQEDTSRRRVRALFSYTPLEDPLHPCPEAGLHFTKGDVLELLDSSDPHWWQARQEEGVGVKGEQRGVGLIPSRSLQEKKCLLRPEDEGTRSLSRRGSGGSKRLKKIMYETRHSEEFEADDVKTYEEVSLLYPRPGVPRAIVLIGPPGVGRNELKRRMLMLNPERFGTTIPHTSRSARQGEVDGVDYHFTRKSDMERWVKEGRFIEYGEYRGNLYGTLTDSARMILAQGRTPVLNPHPQALRILRGPELRPVVISVRPPPFPALKETRSSARARSTFEASGYSRGFTDDELKQMIVNGEHLETLYGHSFDYTLVNGHLEFAFRELCHLLERMEREPQWVPSAWLT